MATPKPEVANPVEMPDDVEKYENLFHFYCEIPDRPYYREIIHEKHLDNELVFCYEHLAEYDPALATRLRENPEKALDDATEALKNIMRIERGGPLTPLEEELIRCRVFTKNNSLYVPIRELEESHIEKLVFVRGTVTGISKVKPEIATLVVECELCGHQFEIEQFELTMHYPEKCMNPGCKSKRFITVRQDTKRSNWQLITVVEAIDDLPDGRIPENISVIMRNNLVKRCFPGDNFGMMAIYRMWPVKGKLRVWDTDLEGVMIEATSSQPISLTISDEDQEKIDKLMKNPQIRTILLRSFAPNIVGRDDAKMAILLLIVKGVAKKTTDGKHLRGDIHVLLIGDPGVGKSDMMESLRKTCQRVIMCQGGGASKVGLTATTVKDEKTGKWALQAGALALADRGYCCIDEMDKMEDEDRANIAGAMEQQRINIDKAGIHAEILSRTSVLGTANPKGGRWDFDKTAIENLQKLPPWLLSRFDLIIGLPDKPDHERDSKIADAQLGLNEKPIPTCEDETQPVNSTEEEITQDLLRRYLYVVSQIQPKIDREALLYIKSFYLTMRDQFVATKAVSLSARNLAGITRLCEAWGKLGGQNLLGIDDVKAFINEIYLPYLETVGYDVKNRQFDVDMLCKRSDSGIASSVNNAQNYVLSIINAMIREKGKDLVIFDDVIDYLSLDVSKLEDIEPKFAIQKLINEKRLDLIIKDGEKYLKILGRK